MQALDLSGQKMRVRQALQETKFAMNEFGAHVKSAVALEFSRTCAPIEREPKRIVRIDKPFYIGIMRPHATTILLLVY